MDLSGGNHKLMKPSEWRGRKAERQPPFWLHSEAAGLTKSEDLDHTHKHTHTRTHTKKQAHTHRHVHGHVHAHTHNKLYWQSSKEVDCVISYSSRRMGGLVGW